jgi:hypothetical protein
MIILIHVYAYFIEYGTAKQIRVIYNIYMVKSVSSFHDKKKKM